MTPRELVCRHAFGVTPEQIGEVAILMERDRTEHYKGAFDRVLHEIKGGVYPGVTGTLSGVTVTAIYSKGPADIADCVAFLAQSETRCRTVFSTGSIGGLGPAVGMGDFVLVDDAVGNDGYSRFLAWRDGVDGPGLFGNIIPATGPAIDALEPVVADVVSGYKVQAHRGRIFTTPGVSLEAPAFLEEIVAQGAIAIDMETAQFYAACREYGMASGAFHWVTDLPMTRSFLQRLRDPAAAQADWDLKHPIWLNMTKIVTSILRGYIEKRRHD
jgi:nucleoside phosphorylase